MERPNWDFEEPTFLPWTTTGKFTDWQPINGHRLTLKRIPELEQFISSSIGGDYWRDLAFPVGHKGHRWLTTAFSGASSDDGFDQALTGAFISKSFVIDKKVISFLLGGGADPERLRVELLLLLPAPDPSAIQIEGASYELAAFHTGAGKELMRRASWDVSSLGLLGRTARIRILDNSSTGHLNVDDFRFQDSLPAADVIPLGGQSYPSTIAIGDHLYDSDSPVWGFADLHSHPMSYLGFGGKIMHGQPDGGASDPLHQPFWLSTCNTNHGGWGLDNPQGDYWRQILMAALDNAASEPHGYGWHADKWLQFSNWPVFNTISHQQMWYEWLKRAHDGGLRVIVALCINNPLLAAVSKGHLPSDDRRVGDAQISELKAFATRHQDFMEIAYDPFQLRDIVRRGKLAVVIGSELDDLGNFARNASVHPSGGILSELVVSAELRRLHSLGVRYVFPVHLVDNKFGGTAIAGLMLNLANKYINGVGFEVITADPLDEIHFWLDNVDFRTFIGMEDIPPDVANVLIGSASAAGAPLIPLLLPWITTAVESLGAIPPGSAMGSGLLPIALLGAANLLPPLMTMLAIDQGDVIQAIIPLPGNYPIYPTKAEAPSGVRNQLGLTPLGRFAIQEMMRLGMMIDIDHMSQDAVDGILLIAGQTSPGYPLNSGHNGFRELSLHERPENSRSFEQIEKLRPLGGLLGVGWENSKGGSFTRSFSELVPNPAIARSDVANDSAGTTKTWAQTYLLAIEQLGASNVALGTDIDGFVISPGPRFGPQGAFGLAGEEARLRLDQIKAQRNGVLYEPRHGPALTTPAFRGRAIDPEIISGLPRTSLGYAYSIDQADFYAALSIFHWLRADVLAGRLNIGSTENEVRVIASRLNSAYTDKYHDFDLSGGSREHIANYAHGLLAGIFDWNIGDDLKPDKTATTKIGKAVYRTCNVPGYQLSPEIGNNPAYRDRYESLLPIWDDYQQIFGSNLPMKRARNNNSFKEWDINFEGVAHYGLLPDFLQDLRNVGLQTPDLGVLFRSAEDFAVMWTRSLADSSPPSPPPSYIDEDKVILPGDTSLEGLDVVVDGSTLTLSDTHSLNSLILLNGAVLTHPAAPSGEPNNLNLTITGDLAIDHLSSIDLSGQGYSANKGPGKGQFDGSAGSGAGYGATGGSTQAGTPGGPSYGSALEPLDLGSGGGNGIGTGPYITYLDSHDGQRRITINGIFGSTSGQVHMAGVPLTIVSWSSTAITCNIPDSGPGSAGEVVVTANNLKSNPRYLTEWRGGITYELLWNHPVVDPNITGTPRLRLNVQLHFRADIAPYRPTPSGALTHRNMIGLTAAPDSSCHWQADGGISNILGGQVFYGETWNSSGSLSASQPIFYMLAGILPSQRLIPLEFDLQYRDAYRPESMFGLMAPSANPDRDVQLGYTMGPAQWDTGPDPYPIAIWDEQTYTLPPMSKGPSTFTLIPAFPWFSMISPLGPTCTSTYHREPFLATPGTTPPLPGGMGGGALRLQVNRHTQLDGAIRANGIAGAGGAFPGGGGSGGSLFLDLDTLTGIGTIEAKGGNSGGPSAGGGAGGRIALKVRDNSFTGSYLVQGGLGAQPGGRGTLEGALQPPPPVLIVLLSPTGDLSLSWPVSQPGWILQWTSSLAGSTTVWNTVPSSLYQVVGTKVFCTESISSSGSKFFRLRTL